MRIINLQGSWRWISTPAMNMLMKITVSAAHASSHQRRAERARSKSRKNVTTVASAVRTKLVTTDKLVTFCLWRNGRREFDLLRTCSIVSVTAINKKTVRSKQAPCGEIDFQLIFQHFYTCTCLAEGGLPVSALPCSIQIEELNHFSLQITLDTMEILQYQCNPSASNGDTFDYTWGFWMKSWVSTHESPRREIISNSMVGNFLIQ